jgi:hypothetical protein
VGDDDDTDATIDYAEIKQDDKAVAPGDGEQQEAWVSASAAGYPEYDVSTHRSVRRCSTGLVLAKFNQTATLPHGYVHLNGAAGSKTFGVARLVDIVFGGGDARPRGNVRRPSEQLDADTGAVIKQFRSIAKASRDTKIPVALIGDACHGRVDSAGGSRWRFCEGPLAADDCARSDSDAEPAPVDDEREGEEWRSAAPGGCAQHQVSTHNRVRNARTRAVLSSYGPSMVVSIGRGTHSRRVSGVKLARTVFGIAKPARLPSGIPVECAFENGEANQYLSIAEASRLTCIAGKDIAMMCRGLKAQPDFCTWRFMQFGTGAAAAALANGDEVINFEGSNDGAPESESDAESADMAQMGTNADEDAPEDYAYLNLDQDDDVDVVPSTPAQVRELVQQWMDHEGIATPFAYDNDNAPEDNGHDDEPEPQPEAEPEQCAVPANAPRAVRRHRVHANRRVRDPRKPRRHTRSPVVFVLVDSGKVLSAKALVALSRANLQ